MATLLTTSFQKINEITVYNSGSLKAYVRTYAKYTTQDMANNQTKVVYEDRFYYNQSSSYSYSISNGVNVLDGTTKNTGAKSYSGGSEHLIQTVNRTINHNNDGSSPTINVAHSWKDSLKNTLYKGNASIIVPNIERYPILTNAPSFNDEDNPTIQYSTTLGEDFDGATVSAGIFKTDNTVLVAYKEVNVPLGSYTFNLTTSERNALLQAFTSTSPYQVKYKLKTSVNGTDYISEKTATFEVINDTPNVTISKYENNAVIRGFAYDPIIINASNCDFTFTITTSKYNDLTKFYFTHNNQEYELAFITSDTGATKQYTATIQNIKMFSNSISYRYKTTRGQERTIEYGYVAYGTYTPVDVTTATINRPSATSDDVLINNLKATVNGAINYEVRGNIYTEINSYTLSYKINEGSYQTISSSDYTIDDGELTLNNNEYEITNGLSYSSNGNIEIKLIDLLSQDSETYAIKKGVATMELGEHDLQVNGSLYIADINRANIFSVLSNTYSSNEIQVGTWKDEYDNDIPLYRKVVEQNLANNTNEQQINTGITNGDLVFLENAFIENTSSGWIRPIMFFSSSNYYIQIEPSVIKFKMYTATANLKLYAIILYTKNTS